MLKKGLKGQAGVAAGILAVVVAVVAVANFANLQLSGNQVAQSLVAHWTLDETTLPTASDSAGGDDIGKVNNDAGNPVTDAPWTANGRIRGGLDLSTKFYHIKVQNSARINNLNSFTMGIWFKQTSTGSQTLMSKRDNVLDAQGNPVQLSLYVQSTLKYSISTANGVTCDSGVTISPNTWYHAAVTYDGPTVQIYVNGQLKNTCYPPGTTTTNTGDLYIGAENPSSTAFRGIIDDVRFYNTALSAADINSLIPTAPPTTPTPTQTATPSPSASGSPSPTTSASPTPTPTQQSQTSNFIEIWHAPETADNKTVKFFAAYSQNSTGLLKLINDGTCKISFSDSQSFHPMAFVQDIGYEYSRKFEEPAKVSYTVSCSHVQYPQQQQTREAEIIFEFFNVVLLEPAATVKTKYVNFVCEAAGKKPGILSLYTDTSGEWKPTASISVKGSKSPYRVNFKEEYVADGDYKWNCEAQYNGITAFASKNQSFRVSSSAITCDESADCGQWRPENCASDEFQTRACNNTARCKYKEGRGCAQVVETSPESGNGVTLIDDQETTSEKSKTDEGGGPGILTIFLIILVIAGGAAFYFLKIKKKKEPEKEEDIFGNEEFEEEDLGEEDGDREEES